MPQLQAELDVGDDAVCTVTFTVAAVATNPSVVTWRVWPPGAPTPTQYVSGTAPEATNPAVGTFRLQVPVTAAGEWRLKCDGTGTAKGSVIGGWWAWGEPA
jgi:hypothetical protein